jgi:plastocyanin
MSSASAKFSAIDPATAGVISGTVHFAGTPPQRIPIDMGQDPACSLSDKPNLTEQYVVHDGGLANVYLYIKSGLGDRVYAPTTTPVILDQQNCRYVPHVIAVMAGQPIEVHNSDSTMHNVHPMPTVAGNQTSDITQAPHGDPVRQIFSTPEIMLPVRCNNHPWMEAFINVAPNPFYAVTDENGHFEIKGLPPGAYTLAAVHEKLGEQDMTVTVRSQNTAVADLTFKKQ